MALPHRPMNRILLVEANPALRAELQRSLERAGYSVSHAESCRQASGQLRQARPDAILIGFDEGQELDSLESLLERADTPPAIAIVTPRSQALALSLIRCGVHSVLRKPFDLRELESQLSEVLPNSKRPPAICAPFITRDPKTLRTLRLAEALSDRSATFVIEGETGTGKRQLARRIHEIGSKRNRAFHSLDLADRNATRDTLESTAEIGTLLLPGIHEVPADSQQLLLEWLRHEARERDTPSDSPHVVATTREPVSHLVTEGRLRADLANQLSVVSLTLPPLRERLCDIPALIRHFAAGTGRLPEDAIPITREFLDTLSEHPFHGNLRELENRVKRLADAPPEGPISAAHLLNPGPKPAPKPRSADLCLKQLERDAIERSLARHDNNRTQASRALGISVRTLRNKLQRYGIA